MAERKIIAGQLFKEQRVELGEATFVDCVFHHCDLVYDGRAVQTQDCDFEDNRWKFEGPAGDTLKMLGHIWTIGGRRTVAYELSKITGIPFETTVAMLRPYDPNPVPDQPD